MYPMFQGIFLVVNLFVTSKTRSMCGYEFCGLDGPLAKQVFQGILLVVYNLQNKRCVVCGYWLYILWLVHVHVSRYISSCLQL